MSYLSNDNIQSDRNEDSVLERLEEHTGLTSVKTPIFARFDFLLQSPNFFNVVGEIKTRERFFSDGWFVADKKREHLKEMQRVLSAKSFKTEAWFVIYCVGNDSIYLLDLDSDYEYETLVMTNCYSTSTQSESGRMIPATHWQVLPSSSVLSVSL